eukprot:TRINITY_DN177_c0_g1_i2.p1 TRINITY_DN177_c0_g1~~TRINITY_DN177_c0_g1_i2.p1  ORF type:complete len:472 (+),score=104.41 TRINITY_DN177_c0_g1_i2:198-1613(+)
MTSKEEKKCGRSRRASAKQSKKRNRTPSPQPSPKVLSEPEEIVPDAEELAIDPELRVGKSSATDGLICSICFNILDDPQQLNSTECTHAFCSSCIHKWIAKRKSPTCPKCRAPIKEKDLAPAKFAVSMIQGLKIHCLHYQEGKGCKKTFVLGKDKRGLIEHLSACPFQEVKCPCCSAKVERRLWDQHAIECPEVMVECPQCSQSMAQKLLKAHADVSDDEHEGLLCRGFQYCPNKCLDDDGNVTSFPTAGSALKDHLALCPNALIECSICSDVKVARCEMDKHMKESMQQHILVLSSKTKNSSPTVSLTVGGWKEREEGERVRSTYFNAFGYRWYASLEKSSEEDEEDEDDEEDEEDEEDAQKKNPAICFGLYRDTSISNDEKLTKSSATQASLNVSYRWMIKNRKSNEVGIRRISTQQYDIPSSSGWYSTYTLDALTKAGVYDPSEDVITAAVFIDNVVLCQDWTKNLAL